MKAIFGLGNPGERYRATRHNIGFIAIQKIASLYRVERAKSKFNTQYYECEKNFLVMPQTYMNNSGVALQQFTSFFKIPIKDIIVIHDDIDLEMGRIKVKIGGGHGGHNGLRSIDQHIGSNYARIRLGVGRPSNPSDVADFVLQKFSPNEMSKLEEMINFVSKNIETLLDKEISTENLNNFLKSYTI